MAPIIASSLLLRIISLPIRNNISSQTLGLVINRVYMRKESSSITVEQLTWDVSHLKPLESKRLYEEDHGREALTGVYGGISKWSVTPWKPSFQKLRVLSSWQMGTQRRREANMFRRFVGLLLSDQWASSVISKAQTDLLHNLLH